MNQALKEKLSAILGMNLKKDYTSVSYAIMRHGEILAADSLGLGSIWIHRAREVFGSEEGRAILAQLGVEGDYEGIGHCAVGFWEGQKPEPPARREGRVFSA